MVTSIDEGIMGRSSKIATVTIKIGGHGDDKKLAVGGKKEKASKMINLCANE